MSDDEYDTHCPLCCEEMDLSDRNFLPCPCGYKVCMWCWHHIRENMNGLCPACRTPYNSDPHAFSAVDREDVVKLKKEKRQKEKQEKKTAERVVVSAPGAGVKSTASTVTDRRHLHNYRVVQRNLVYVIGVPANYASEETLRKPEFFGQYGKIGKVVIHRNHSSVHSTVSVYVTFVYKEDARASIQSLDGHWLDQNHLLRASFGTTKYCNNFIRGVPCNNPECVYLHDLGDDDDRFTKEEIQAGHSKIPPVPGKDQTLVTGGGGPSGTGKRPTGEPILPPPVFIQDNYPALGSTASTAQASSAAAPAGLSTPTSAASTMMPAPGLSTTTNSSAAASGVPLVPPGVSRPATVSRAGTGTWGGANTIAAITGSASLRSVSTEREREIEREREDGHTNTPLHFPPLSSSVSSSNLQAQASQASAPAQAAEETSRVPTTILKRSASNTTNNTTPVSLPPAPAPVVDPTPAPVPTTTTTSATTTPSATTAAPAAPAVKTKPKTAKELAREAAAEKKAAAAAARAEKQALAAQAAATAAATAVTLDASATPPASSGDGESKSSTTTAPSIAPTPKLSAKQQMLANKAEKAAKAQAAALAAQEAREAARAAKESAKAAAREHALALHNGGMSKKDAKNAASAASTTASTPSTADASIVAHDSTLDLSILQQVAPPVTSLLESPPEYALVPGFNGLSVNSLFPVPVSSLSCSVWSNILRASNEDLSINPFGVLEVPVSELLDLMLPPVDAMLSSAPCWPRPLAYYSQGMQAGGVTFSPAGKHIHQRSTNDMALLPPMLHLPSSVTQQQHQLHSQQQSREHEVQLSPAELAALAQRRSKVAALLQAISTETEAPEVLPAAPALVVAGTAGAALGPPPGVGAPPGVGRPANTPLGGAVGAAPGTVRSNGRTAGPAHLPPPPGVVPVAASVATSATALASGSASGSVGATNMNALRQLFPGVKMSVSSSK